jgi:hypothetical protein
MTRTERKVILDVKGRTMWTDLIPNCPRLHCRFTVTHILDGQSHSLDQMHWQVAAGKGENRCVVMGSEGNQCCVRSDHGYSECTALEQHGVEISPWDWVWNNSLQVSMDICGPSLLSTGQTSEALHVQKRHDSQPDGEGNALEWASRLVNKI